MARTVDQAAHQTRRNDILDAAQQLVQTRGYEQMSIHDVLAALGISKGALYHYFNSKQALLVGIVDRMADQLRDRLAPVVQDPELKPLDKLNRVFQTLAGWKIQRRQDLVALLRAWNSDGNALMRQKTRAGITDRLSPLFDAVIEQGVRDGSFPLPAGAGYGRLLLSLIHDLNDHLGDLFFAYEAGDRDLTDVGQAITVYTTAVERVLGVPPQSICLVDLPALYTWFDPTYSPRRSKTP